MLLVFLLLTCALSAITRQLVSLLQMTVLQNHLGEALSRALLIAVALLDLCKVVHVSHRLAQLVLLLLAEVALPQLTNVLFLHDLLAILTTPSTLLIVKAVLLEPIVLVDHLLPLVIVNMQLLLFG